MDKCEICGQAKYTVSAEMGRDCYCKDFAGWISVKNRLPALNHECLVWYGPGIVSVGMYTESPRQWIVANTVGKNWRFCDERFDLVTHWMALPEPPESEE
jgi:hypothetical protein